MSSFESYWVGIRQRIAAQTEGNRSLKSLVIKKQRVNLNNSGLSFRTKSGCLIPHCYTKFSDEINLKTSKKSSLSFKKRKAVFFSSLIINEICINYNIRFLNLSIINYDFMMRFQYVFLVNN